ncbi:hypothetical protein DDP54_07735 [Cellulomonas sp. WB94]|uniref:restriction system modified-DNA reader domain-containing protein n=1 Tax=Cellulomonas sp. WB94 TaxID=2173174 RepID=UPI000D570D21|nr:hypothetical protein [Cellulomonas sp. WB94]PVU82910.1 hypothetical protein DDP54_07735 [Cellulomonas sp. WB94]
MRRIEIDDEVYAELEKHAKGFEQPNDVLRRLLLIDHTGRARPRLKPVVVGRLLPLMAAGLVHDGDVIFHERPRKGDRFEAKVVESGWILSEGTLYQAPSAALSRLVGSQIDGWANWTHQRSGKTLRELRFDLGSKQSE